MKHFPEPIIGKLNLSRRIGRYENDPLCFLVSIEFDKLIIFSLEDYKRQRSLQVIIILDDKSGICQALSPTGDINSLGEGATEVP